MHASPTHSHNHPPVAFTKWTRAEEMGGVETQFATSYLGHYALCKGLLHKLTRAGTPVTEKGEGSPARIILVSSVLHHVRKGGIGWVVLGMAFRHAR